MRASLVRWTMTGGRLALVLAAALAVAALTETAAAQTARDLNFRSYGHQRAVRSAPIERPGRGKFPPSRHGRGGFPIGVPIGIPIGIGIIGAPPVSAMPIDDSSPSAQPARRPHRTAQRKPPSRSAGGNGAPPRGETRFVPDEVVVQLRPGSSPQAVARIAARYHLTRLESMDVRLTGESLQRWRIPDKRSVGAVVRTLQRDAGVRSAQPNYLYALQEDTTPAAPADPKPDPAQYAVGKLHLSEAHALVRGDKVLIGVVDSGVDRDHPELAGTIADTFDALPGEPPHVHGTAIAGTIAEHARLIGVAPAAHILAARAFGAGAATAQATTFNIIKGIDWTAAKGARVINMSFAGPRDPAIERELAAAYKRKIVLVAAAGNAGPKSPPLYPAADPHVIAVAATDAQDKLFPQSNRGSYISVSAPGVDILAPAPGKAYQVISGTSLSAAYISGLAALLIERNPTLGPQQVRKVLETTAHDLGRHGRDREFGYGLVDAYRAVEAVAPRTAQSSPPAH